MTVRERLKNMLTERGLSDSQAEEILADAIPQIEKLSPGDKITWGGPAEDGGYPDNFYIVLWRTTLRKVALEWIDENAPKAWFREMFELETS